MTNGLQTHILRFTGKRKPVALKTKMRNIITRFASNVIRLAKVNAVGTREILDVQYFETRG